jgi:endonuclease-3
MNKKDLPFFAETLNKMYPNAKTELYYNNNFQLLIAILMSAQTTDIQVNKVNRNLFEFLETPKD